MNNRTSVYEHSTYFMDELRVCECIFLYNIDLYYLIFIVKLRYKNVFGLNDVQRVGTRPRNVNGFDT